MKKKMNGSIALEAAIIIPLILMIFATLMLVIFYYHDKNVLNGAVNETATIMSRQEEPSEEKIAKYLEKRIKGKLILFSKIHLNVEMDDSQMLLICRTEKNKMTLRVEAGTNRTEPETFLRNIRIVEKLSKKLGE